MSMTAVRSYFVARCEGLGRVEHKDAFNFANISRNEIPKAFHIELGSFAGSPINQQSLDFTCDVVVRLFFHGYRYPVDGVDAAVIETEKLVKSSLKASNRLAGNLKNVVLQSVVIEPFETTNDNAIISTITFTASALVNVEGA